MLLKVFEAAHYDKKNTHFSLIDNFSGALTSELFEFSILAGLILEMLFMLFSFCNAM